MPLPLPKTAQVLPLNGPIRRVLLVDDSRLQLRIMTALLEKLGLEVQSALSAEEGLALCAEAEPDLVISDWMMPGMDGLEFCRRFRKLSRNSYGYFILLTSKSEKGEIARGLDAGADDFLTKPIASDELRARISAGARILSMERELSKKNRVISDTLAKLQAVYNDIERDLKQARNIQEALVPEHTRTFGKSRVSLLLKPCGHVGGDLVGMFSPARDRVGAYSIDVSGHGITSALVTARVAGYLSSRFPDQNLALERRDTGKHALRPPEEVGLLLNERLAADPGVSEYLTMLYFTANLRTGRIDMVQAGHPPPLLLRADGSAEFFGAGGVPIGLIDSVSYERQTIQMATGDRLLIYTDGFTEAVMKGGAMLEEEGLLALVREHDEKPSGMEFLDDLFWRLRRDMSPEVGMEDDVSAVLLEYGGK
ncbi:PP2C family protein-serine/threonine phosphatase [Thalassococcus sp. BH17M4-6]|uniref:PP2C family protein-serine/threonine phosphatase n=1 Tax=Thalassococcus sp. BH17M4-6 TaxID=3413148 RepID=UPI003BE79E2E